MLICPFVKKIILSEMSTFCWDDCRALSVILMLNIFFEATQRNSCYCINCTRKGQEKFTDHDRKCVGAFNMASGAAVFLKDSPHAFHVPYTTLDSSRPV